MNDQLNQTLEEATRAREKLIRDANTGASWIARHPLTSLLIGIALVTAVAVLGIKLLTH